MEKKTKLSLLYIAFGVALFAALMNLSAVFGFVQNIFSLLLPIVTGLIVAFVLSVPMNGFEKLLGRLFGKLKLRMKDTFVSAVSLLLTFGAVILVVTLVITLAVPALVESVMSLIDVIRDKWPEWMTLLSRYDIDTESISQWVSQLDLEQLLKNVTGSAGALLGSVVDVSATIVSGVVTAVFGFVIAVYVLLSKKDLARHSKKVLYAYLKSSAADRVCHVCSLVHSTYSKFLSGQCVEAIILAVLIFAAFSIFKLPYAGLVAVLAGFFAFIPYVGAFAACAVGAFLTLIINPSQVLLSVIVYLVVQFIENQFIYPHVVGSSVGLSALWTLIAALIGGELFGLLGMIFFIPLFAVIYSLFSETTNRKLKEKENTPQKL